MCLFAIDFARRRDRRLFILQHQALQVYASLYTESQVNPTAREREKIELNCLPGNITKQVNGGIEIPPLTVGTG